MKRAIVDSGREVYGSVRVGGKNPKNVGWNDVVKAAVEIKVASRKGLLGARDDDAKELYIQVYQEEKRRVKRCIYQTKREVNKQFRKKMDQDVDGNRQLFSKEVSKVNRGKVKSYNRIKDGNGRL